MIYTSQQREILHQLGETSQRFHQVMVTQRTLQSTAGEHIARAANALIDVISQSNELTALFVRHGDLWCEFIDTLE